MPKQISVLADRGREVLFLGRMVAMHPCMQVISFVLTASICYTNTFDTSIILHLEMLLNIMKSTIPILPTPLNQSKP